MSDENERNESFVFYGSFYEAANKLPEGIREKYLYKLLGYMTYGIEPTFTKDEWMQEALFISHRPQIDVNNKRRQNGKKGGAPYKNTNAKKQPMVDFENNKKQPNVNVNLNVNDNANNYLSRKNFGTPISEEAQNKTANTLPAPTASDSDESIKAPAEKNEIDEKSPQELRPPADTQTKTQKPIDKNARRLSEKLYALHKKLDPQFNCTQARLDNWASEIEKLQRLDKRPYDEIEAVIEWAKADSFWQVNIISAEKLRKQYSRLLLQMQKQKTNRPRDDTKLYEQQDFSKNALPEVLKQSRLSEQKDINLDDVVF